MRDDWVGKKIINLGMKIKSKDSDANSNLKIEGGYIQSRGRRMARAGVFPIICSKPKKALKSKFNS